ncbi:MAG: YneF family protein [Bacilli bacterium]|nr:YneF family protein [Bacilli bacterium]
MLTLFAWDPGWFGLVMGALIIGAVAGFFIARTVISKQIQKNPPINEQMIRAMYRQMGRKPTEAQIRAIMNSVNKNSSL